MPITSVHQIHGIKNGSTFFSQLSNARFSPGISRQVLRAAGFPLPLYSGVTGQEPAVSFSTTQLRTLLGLASVGLADLSAAATLLYLKKADDYGFRVADATTQHTTLSVAKSALAWSRISGGLSAPATADAMLEIIYDGVTEPVVPAGSQALAGTPVSGEEFFPGPLTVNGTLLEGVQEFTLESGIVIRKLASDGELYPTFVYGAEAFPVLTARVTRLAISDLGLNGSSVSSWSFFLRRGSTTGRYSNAASQHLKFSGTAGIASVDETAGGENNEASTLVRLTCLAPSAAGAALTTAIDQAIS